jgi:hypothetical protein
VFLGSFGLFWTKACVGESWDSIMLYLFLYVLFPYMLTSNAFKFSTLNLVVQKSIPCCPREYSWSLEPVGMAGTV